MWVWQSQAPAGTSKFTGVDGWDTVARALWLRMVTPAATEASRTVRLVNIGRLPIPLRRWRTSGLPTAVRVSSFLIACRLTVFGPTCKDRSAFPAFAGRTQSGRAPHRGIAPCPDLLSRGRAEAVPGVAHLMIVHLGQVVRRIERQRLDVEPDDGAEQRVGGDHAIALRANQARLCRDQVLLRVQNVQRSALAAGRFLAHAVERDRRGADLGFRCRHCDLGTFIGDPGTHRSGAGLVANL